MCSVWGIASYKRFNAAEYIPLYVILFLYLNSLSPSTYAIALAMVATLSRFSHATGMFLAASVTERHPLRFYGAFGTYLTLFALSLTLLQHAL